MHELAVEAESVDCRNAECACEICVRSAAGAGVLLVSTELDEVMALSDRIAVMFKGKIVGTLRRAEFTAEALGLLMAGAT